jgi:hypothetical protein
MDEQNKNEIREAARLLGKRGGTRTLEKYGRDQLKYWGQRGAEFGKLGGRPLKPWEQLSEGGRYARRRREAKTAQGDQCHGVQAREL